MLTTPLNTDTVNADRYSYNVNLAVLRPENCPTSFSGSILTRPPLLVSRSEGRVGQETRDRGRELSIFLVAIMF